ncbi:MAG: MCE family protein [Bacteroidetes bacterium]|nr:MCE family protein [Bacteroidota bacterium]
MKMSKEVRIGILVASAILIFFAGFYFLKGANVFSAEKEYICHFDNVQGLQASAAVQVKGMAVGRVSDIKLINNKVKVIISVSKKVNVNEGTVANLTSADLLGTKVISLELGTGKELEKNTELPTKVEGGILDNLSVELSPLITDVRHAVGKLDTALLSINQILNDSTKERLNSTIASLDRTMSNLKDFSGSLNAKSGELGAVIDNANSFTSNLSSNNAKINTIIDNAKATTDNLSKAPIQQTVKDVQAAADELRDVLAKINNNQGTLGMAVNDKQLYNNLTETLKTLNSLMADLQSHPSRYINVTIFGKKRKD